jgi:hypothetical protein
MSLLLFLTRLPWLDVLAVTDLHFKDALVIPTPLFPADAGFPVFQPESFQLYVFVAEFEWVLRACGYCFCSVLLLLCMQGTAGIGAAFVPV